MTKNIENLETAKEWMLNGEKIKINKIERVSFDFKEAFNTRTAFQEISPDVALKNVVKNTALLPSGMFIDAGNGTIVARISEAVGKTLIMTSWRTPSDAFHKQVLATSVADEIPEEKFYITSRIS